MAPKAMHVTKAIGRKAKFQSMLKTNAKVRKVNKARFDEEARLILDILNDAWSDNWGFVPFTEREIGYAGKKFKPIVREDLIMVAEYDGEPVAFMMTLPDLNEVLKPMGGRLFPFNWIKLLAWLRKSVHAHGATLDPAELMQQATGSQPSTQAYLAHLQSRFL